MALAAQFGLYLTAILRNLCNGRANHLSKNFTQLLANVRGVFLNQPTAAEQGFRSYHSLQEGSQGGACMRRHVLRLFGCFYRMYSVPFRLQSLRGRQSSLESSKGVLGAHKILHCYTTSAFTNHVKCPANMCCPLSISCMKAIASAFSFTDGGRAEPHLY